MIMTILKRASELNLLNYLDIQLAIRLVKDENNVLLLVFALLSSETRSGHVCLFIDKLEPIYLFNGKQTEIAFELWEAIGSPSISKIYAELKQSDAVCNVSQSMILSKPLILSGNKLYFQRMWADEGIVANFFSQHSLEIINEQHLITILNYFFTSSNIQNWQKIAIAIAVTSRISVISGAPGTGKTTIVARLLATLVKLSKKKIIIKLATPTGKAAARLIESLNNALLNLNLSSEEKEIIPKEAYTIHRLLGSQQNRQLFRYHKTNKLLLDVLIIDEASMIDLYMMARLVEAIPDHARVIILGDKDQLSSVEAGAVLSELCRFSEYGYSYKRAMQLSKITGYDLSNFVSNNGVKIKDRICLLRKNYRFNEESEIGQFSRAINQNNIKLVEQLLIQKGTNISFHSINLSETYIKFLYDAAIYYRSYLDMIKQDRNPEEIISAFNSFRLLTALRDGSYGVIGLNNNLEQLLHHQGSIRYTNSSLNRNYEGRPIIITKNDHSLGLFNGDIGIMLRDNNQDLKVYFQLPNGLVKKIQPNRLSQYETAFVMTVHKSQGSEFDHAALILPPVLTSIINKELIYTGITRAKNKLTIYANKHIFIKALLIQTERHSGFKDRLF
ncbi:MAG: exodeoxyribonuclease V subunit alpha [Arsenophonus sp.]